ncbi:DUF1697 domain-containing protein [Pseudanabaena sp. FACHB-1998]|uniref:DUF1697 domain-containing protein n=1 Tax=Pseudanabaena sp. FACHB-1998 TaxID=2692858 RepID=UPI001680401F|nr:DUF1697 domain-containing protein [Pseudanabaena sp. FACHB-1998]MBD2176706.1 DUF1697 domain-containing protein [Pseudanabaena sp. FACHB-1998]
MHTYIAFFRGINVGGKNSLPMKDLTSIFEILGASNAKTYIQSGNVVFQIAPKDISSFSKRLRIEIKEQRGFEPYILIIESSEVETAMKNNPFPEAESEPSSLHLGFLAFVPENPDLKKLESLKKDNEQFCLIDRIFYLHAPEGVGRSKLAASSEKLLGVPMTDRNWNTVCKLKEMATLFALSPNKSQYTPTV